MTSALSWRGAPSQECRRGLRRWLPGSGRQPVNSLARCPSGTSCARLPTHRSRHCAEALLLGVRLCANECARMWGPVRRRRGCPGEVEGCWIWLAPLGLQVESEDLWLAVDLSPSPGSLLLPLPASDLHLLSSGINSLHKPLPSYPLSCPCCLSRRAGMQRTGPEFPQMDGSGSEVPAFWYRQGYHGNLGA